MNCVRVTHRTTHRQERQLCFPQLKHLTARWDGDGTKEFKKSEGRSLWRSALHLVAERGQETLAKQSAGLPIFFKALTVFTLTQTRGLAARKHNVNGPACALHQGSSSTLLGINYTNAHINSSIVVVIMEICTEIWIVLGFAQEKEAVGVHAKISRLGCLAGGGGCWI